MDTEAKEFQWQLISSNEEKNGGPSSRTYFTMVTRGDSLFFFGGFGDSKGRYNDLRRFNTTTSSWSLLANSGVYPKPIYLHSAAVDRDHMYVFGGSSGKDTNDFYDYNFILNTWSLLPKHDGIAYPCPRYGHASIVCNGRLLIVGGCKHTMVYFQDTYSYDLSTKSWAKLGDVPLDMAYHSLCAYNNRVYLFGGYNGVKFGEALYVLNWDTGQWNKVPAKGPEPSPRCGCAAQVVGDSLWIFGGYTGSGHTNDLYRLDLITWTWQTVTASNKPLSRAYLQAAVVSGTMYVFGGYDGSSCVTDFRNIPLVNPVVKFSLSSSASLSTSVSKLSMSLDVVKLVRDQSLSTQVEIVMKHFSRGGGVLEASDVALLLQNISENLPLSTSGGQPSDADLPSVKEAVFMGFSQVHALAGVKLMKSQGQDITNANLLLNVLFDHPELDTKEVAPPTPQLEKQSSSNSQLTAKLESARAELNELQQCKICFERNMDCAMIPCGHLIGCKVCAKDAANRKIGCPLCRRPITGHMPVYWS